MSKRRMQYLKVIPGKFTGYVLYIFTVLIFFGFSAIVAQPKVDVTKRVFLFSDMQEIVLSNHPVIRQAGLLSKSAQARVIQSLGNFDPTIAASFGRKVFGGTEYYNHWNSELKVPLWLAGADLKVGYDRNVGIYNNPETKTGNTGLSGIGLSVPLGQGFLIDSRRNTLRQARIMVDYAEAEKVAKINAVWLDAVKDYWNWYSKSQQYQFMSDGVILAEKRFIALRKQVLLGDKPPIDSVEATIAFQDRKVQLQQAEVELNNSRLLLSNNLWDKDGRPLELPAEAKPSLDEKSLRNVNRSQLDSLVSRAAEVHPGILKMQSEQAKLGVEEQYRKELLKPKLNLKGVFLAGRRDFGFVPDNYDFRFANYKIGVDLSFPLFLREERGKLREVRIRQAEVAYGLQQTGREIKTGIISAFNELNAYQAQLELQTRNLVNQQTLVKGELQKFELGESNFFLINTRETKLIDMQIKRADLISDIQKAMAELYYRAGKQLTY